MSKKLQQISVPLISVILGQNKCYVTLETIKLFNGIECVYITIPYLTCFRIRLLGKNDFTLFSETRCTRFQTAPYYKIK